jgi:photosystem II stability/assembly factor-like uncharacterized protein
MDNDEKTTEEQAPEQPAEQRPEQTLPVKKTRKRLFLIVGAILVLLLGAGAAAYVLTREDKTPTASVTQADGTKKTLSFAETGYTGIAEDVLSNQTFDCAPRSEHEWYRSDRTFTIDPTNPDTMYINVEYKGLYKTTDGGKTWTQKVKGIKVYGRTDDPKKGCYSEYPVIRMDPKDNKHLIVGISGGGGGFLDATTPNSQTGGAYQTYDGGETWTLMINDKMDIYVTDLQFDPSNPKTIYYGTASNPASWQGADQNKLYVTKGIVYKTTTSAKDRDWVELPTGLGNRTGAQSILVNPANGKEINVATYSAVRLSADGSGTGISSGKDTSGQQMGILKTTDGGTTWTSIQIPGGSPISEAFMCKNNFKYQYFVPQGTNGPASYTSFDGAATFKKSGTAMDVVAYDPYDASCMHMLGYSTTAGTPTIPNLNLFESMDGGVTWKVHGKLPAEIKDLNDTKTRPSVIEWHPADKNTIFMAGAGGHVWKSADFGMTWATLLSYEILK